MTQTDVAGGNPVADKRADFAYTDAGQLKTITRYADLGESNLVATSTFTYDPSLGWLAGLVHEINNTNEDVVEYAYTHQPDGQIETLTLDRDVDNTLTSETREFTYDQQGQLTQVALDAGGGPATVEQYQYDAAGNRVSATVGSSSSVYTPGAYNRLESVDDGTTVTVFGYDPEGNLVLRFVDADESGSLTTGDTEVTEYAWDHRNRLVSVTNYDTFSDYATNPSQEVEYSYDYLNRLVARTVDGDSEYFIYDHDASTNWALKDLSTSKEGTIPFGADPATDAGQIVLQLDESGEPTHRYLWGPAVDMLLADEAVDSGADQTPGTADDVRWTLSDHQNSVRDIVVLDDNGTPGNPIDDQWIIENHITYRAFGEKAAQTGAVDCVFGFTGRFFDEFTDLQNNHQRWYDAVLAHWQSEDPIGFAAGDANLYRYCANDPVNWVDPSGLVNVGGWLISFFNGELYRQWKLDAEVQEIALRRAQHEDKLLENLERIRKMGREAGIEDAQAIGTIGVELMAASAGMASASVPRAPLGPSRCGPAQTGRVLPTKPQASGVPVLPKSPTSTPLAPGIKPGTYVYVQDAQGVVHVVPQAPGAHPTVLGGGQASAAAGEIVIGPGGVVTEINNISYTFQHGAGVLRGVQRAIEGQGLRVAPNAIKPFQH